MPPVGWKALLGAVVLQLFVLANGDVYIMTPSYNFEPLPDIPADFGPEIPDAGVEGFLRVADPEDGCSTFTYTDFDTNWVALVARNQQARSANCTFDVKVWNAQAAGAIAVIVYDDVYESLIIMSKPKGHPDPYIPSVFMSQKAGLIMKKLMTLDVIRVRITPLSTVAWMSMFMSAFLGLMALGVVLATFYVMRSWSLWLGGQLGARAAGGRAGAPGQQQQQGAGGAGGHGRPHTHQDHGLPADALRALPVLIFDAQAAARYSQPGSPIKGRRSASLGGGGGGSSTGRSRGNSGLATGDLERGLLADYDIEEEDDEGYNLQGSNACEGAEDECYEDAASVGGDGCSRSSSEAGDAVPHMPMYPRLHAGETKRTCAVCLESYAEGEKVRVLPCKHRFHMTCIDQWLTSRRLCPVCKHDASVPLMHRPSPAPASAGQARGGGRGGAGNGSAASGVASGNEVLNGWTLLFQGLVDLFTPPSLVPNARVRISRSTRRAQQQQQQGGVAASQVQATVAGVQQQLAASAAAAAADIERGGSLHSLRNASTSLVAAAAAPAATTAASPIEVPRPAAPAAAGLPAPEEQPTPLAAAGPDTGSRAAAARGAAPSPVQLHGAGIGGQRAPQFPSTM